MRFKIGILGLVLLLSLVQGCGNKKLLQDTKRIGVVGLSYFTTIEAVDENSKESSSSMSGGQTLKLGFKDNKLSLNLEKIDPEALDFFNLIYAELIAAFEKNGFEIVKPDAFLTNENFKTLYPDESKQKKNRFFDNYYIPDPYKSGDYGQKKEVLKQLMQDEKLDAVARISFQLIKLQSKNMIGLTKSKLALRFKVGVIHKSGKSIFTHSRVHTIKSKAGLDVAASFLGGNSFLDITPENQEQFNQLANDFKSYINNKVADALKK